ncbi:MAG: NAD(P)/FAD-dependent oxidoreductase [Alphaproteobacteria bacterium]|nr:NAD(P)/FAD-dependent oxidoreductase [Alphaproteobacteria bacterium]OJV13494.1 MAG: ferredoxin--NADP(+) reductase [Alphaproteobacteria bacterium 33-17]
MKYTTDIAIIGAGPTGLFAVFEAGMLKMKTVVIEALDFIGGQCTALYPEKPIYDIPAHPSILAEDLIKNLEAQAAPFKPEYLLSQQVVKLNKTNDLFELTTSKGNIVECKAVIIAGGCGSFGPNRPPIANLEEYEGKSVFYLINNKEFYRDKTVVIAGGGDSAVDWAINLYDIAKKIYVIHRRDKFRAAPESCDKLAELSKTEKLEMVIPYQLEGLEGDNGQIKHVVVKDLDNNIKYIEADYLLPFFGLSMDLGPILDWELHLEKKHIAVEPSTMATSIPGVYAIGDIATYKNKLKLILNGFAEAATACYDIYNLVYPDVALHFEYSTTKGVEKV